MIRRRAGAKKGESNRRLAMSKGGKSKKERHLSSPSSHQDGSQFSGFFSEGLRQGSGTLTLPDDSRKETEREREGSYVHAVTFIRDTAP